LPVKTARNGLCLMIVPQVLAICCLSPVCHLYQNSLKGMALLKSFSGCFGLHMFERAEWDLTGGTWNLQKYWGSDKHVDGSRVLAAAAHGDITTLQESFALGVDMNYADYDQRTPLHIAATAGQRKVVEFLLRRQVNLETADRWGRTPLDDAAAKGCTETLFMLTHPEQVGYSKPDIEDGLSSGYHSSLPSYGRQIGGEWSMCPSAASMTGLGHQHHRRLVGVKENEDSIFDT